MRASRMCCAYTYDAGLYPIYEFAIAKDLAVQVHHNSDRVGDNDNDWEYVYEASHPLTRCSHPLTCGLTPMRIDSHLWQVRL